MEYNSRLRAARKHANLTQAQLADKVGLSQATVSELERGTSRRSSFTASIAAVCGVSPIWLAEGVGEMLSEGMTSNVEPGPEIKGLVPVISWIQAGDFCEAVDLLPPGEAEEWISCPVSHSQHTYALRVRGASMEPRFREGEIVIVDPKIGADNGRFVIAKKTGANEVTLKKLVIEGDDRYLQAVNPAWPEPIIRIAEEWIICGVVICKMEML